MKWLKSTIILTIHTSQEENISRDPITYTHRDRSTFRSAIEQYSEPSEIYLPHMILNPRRTERTRRIPSRFVSFDSFSPKYRGLLKCHSLIF